MTTPLASAHITDLEGEALNAFRLCINAERRANTDVDRLHARVLGYLILHSPSNSARLEVARLIHSVLFNTENYEVFFDLGKAFVECLFRPFMDLRERSTLYPEESGHFDIHETPADWVDLAERVKQSPFSPSSHEEVDRVALIRDGFRCAVTGQYDFLVMKMSGIEEDEILRMGGLLFTTCAQILPDSSCFGDHIGNVSVQSADYTTAVWKVLREFGYNPQDLTSSGAHNLCNVMTMTREVYEFFSRLEIWFEPVDDKDGYTIQTRHQYIRVPKNCRLTSPNPFIPAPSRQYIKFHATCAKVAHYSGARKYLEKLDDDDSEDLEESDFEA
ncbi:hypothetical protein VKT23_019795 [Stygiomarasmius scandens]|uniref:HNH nuclease domain-containing protein n=1 Tax=Marasmiellus scandens TaxID=2682957 RepID=A0ABR1IPX4_9AGAR